MTRARGYFDVPRDFLLLDGRLPPEARRGVPRLSVATLRLPPAEPERPVAAASNQERVAARAWPVAENRTAVAELTG